MGFQLRRVLFLNHISVLSLASAGGLNPPPRRTELQVIPFFGIASAGPLASRVFPMLQSHVLAFFLQVCLLQSTLSHFFWSPSSPPPYHVTVHLGTLVLLLFNVTDGKSEAFVIDSCDSHAVHDSGVAVACLSHPPCSLHSLSRSSCLCGASKHFSCPFPLHLPVFLHGPLPASRRPPDYSSNLCPSKTFAI